MSAYIVRLAFWAVLLVGIADAILSFLRVEGFHTVLFGEAGGAAHCPAKRARSFCPYSAYCAFWNNCA